MTHRGKYQENPAENGFPRGLGSKKRNADFGFLLTVSMNKTTITDVVPRAFRRVVSAQGPARMLAEGKEPCGVLLLNL